MHSTCRALLCVAFLGLSVTPVRAHDYWVMPATFNPTDAGLIEASFTFGHQFFVAEGIPDLTRFRTFLVQPDGRELPLPVQRISAEHAQLLAPLTGPGTYVLGAVSTVPEYWSATAQGFRPGPASAVPDAESTSKYIKSVKTILTLGSTTATWGQVLGHEIELIPLSDPTALVAGDRLPVQVLWRGEPAAAKVLAVYEGFASNDQEAAVEVGTDTDGRAEVPIDRPGPWLIVARIDRPAPAASGLERENYRAYLLFAVAAAGGDGA